MQDCENVNKDFIFFEYKCCSFIKINSIIYSEKVLNSLDQWVLIVRDNQQNTNIKHLSSQLSWMILNREFWSDRHVEMLQISLNFIHLCKTASDSTDDLRWFKTLLQQLSYTIIFEFIKFLQHIDKNKMNFGTFWRNEKFYDFLLIFHYVTVAAHAVALILAFFADFWQAQ